MMSCRMHRNGRLDVGFLIQEGIVTTEEAFLQGDHEDVPMSLGCHSCIKQKPQMPFFVECYEVDGKEGLYWVKLPGPERSKTLLRVDKTKRQMQGAPIVKFQSRTGQLLEPYQFVLLEDRDMLLRLDLGPKIDDLKRSSPQTPATSALGASSSTKYATRPAKRCRTSESTGYIDSQASSGTRSSSLSTPPETPDQNTSSQSDKRQAAVKTRRLTPYSETRSYSHGNGRTSAEPKTSIEHAGATPRTEIARSQHRDGPEEQYRGQSVNADATRLHTAMVESLQDESDESDPEAEDLLKRIADQRAINARKDQQLRADAELIRTRKLERKQRLEMQLTALKTQEVELDKMLAQTQADLMKTVQRLHTREA